MVLLDDLNVEALELFRGLQRDLTKLSLGSYFAQAAEVLSQEDDMECVGSTDNGVEALTLAAEQQPDVLVMDLVLLKLDGIEVLRRLPEACPGAKAIVVTHLYRNEIVRQCTALGAAYFVPEPCDITALLDRIRQIGALPSQEEVFLPARPSDANLEAAVTEIIH